VSDINRSGVNWWQYLYLAHLSGARADRELYRLVKRQRISKIVEIGIHDLERSVRLVRVAQRFADGKRIEYSALDAFEARPANLFRLSLKHVHQKLPKNSVRVRLLPGEPAQVLRSAANAHLGTDLILIAPWLTEESLSVAWAFVPRMLHDRSIVLRERIDVDGNRSLEPLSRSTIDGLAGSKLSRLVA
jgi:hypothetical protein